MTACCRLPARRLAALAIVQTVVLAITGALPPGAAQAHGSCGQRTNVYVLTAPDQGMLSVDVPYLSVNAGTTLFLAGGAVHPGSRAYWGLYDPVYQRRYFHSTQPARSNCVIHQEPEAVPAARVGRGTWEVWAIYVRWEDNPAHAETSTLVGTLVIS